MADEKKRDQGPIDTKYGTIKADSIVEAQDKDGKARVEAVLVGLSGKEVTLYARGGLMDAVKAKAASGEPTFAVGEIFASGKALSLSALELKAYDATVTSVADPATNSRGEAYQSIKVRVEGKGKDWSVLLKGEDVGTAKVGEKLAAEVAWKASPGENGWSSGLISAGVLKKAPAPKPEADAAPAP